jgi:precorrin-6A/cobalt-precorrin-6A reductase
MTHRPSLLLLAGSAEAHALADVLHARGQSPRIVLPGPERRFAPFDPPAEVQRFATAAQVADYAKTRGITCILDASHGFEADLSRIAAAGAALRDLPYARVLRPAWPIDSFGPLITAAPDVASAASRIAPRALVFAATGRASVPDYEPFQGARLFLRQNRAGGRAPLPDFVEIVPGAPPYDRAGEAALFRHLRIDTLICRNVGGLHSRPKLDAAIDLGLRAHVIDRPPPPAGVPVFFTPEDAIDWIFGS